MTCPRYLTRQPAGELFTRGSGISQGRRRPWKRSAFADLGDVDECGDEQSARFRAQGVGVDWLEEHVIRAGFEGARGIVPVVVTGDREDRNVSRADVGFQAAA